MNATLNTPIANRKPANAGSTGLRMRAQHVAATNAQAALNGADWGNALAVSPER
jgi:hypothetical protein